MAVLTGDLGLWGRVTGSVSGWGLGSGHRPIGWGFVVGQGTQGEARGLGGVWAGGPEVGAQDRISPGPSFLPLSAASPGAATAAASESHKQMARCLSVARTPRHPHPTPHPMCELTPPALTHACEDGAG